MLVVRPRLELPKCRSTIGLLKSRLVGTDNEYGLNFIL